VPVPPGVHPQVWVLGLDVRVHVEAAEIDGRNQLPRVLLGGVIGPVHAKGSLVAPAVESSVDVEPEDA